VTAYQILPCRLAHVREIAQTMRADDRREFELAGMVPRHRLFQLHQMTTDPKAALIDDGTGARVAAIWGDAAALLARDGLMWLVTAPVIEQLPVAFFREARREVQKVLLYRERLRSCIAGPYAKAERFFSLLGFEIMPPELYGGHEFKTIVLRR
jgi:hypothetical protein